MPTLLLELFSEEIPSRMQANAAEQLQRLILAGFEKNMLKPSEVKTFVSPRHLAIQCFGLPEVQPDVKEERRGPKIGAPEQALKGFLSATGLTLDQCSSRDGYYYATIERKGRTSAEVVKEIGESALTAFVWPKSMKWGARSLQWVRPLHKITCLLDSEIVPVQFGHLTASNITHGHRFLSPGEMNITHAEHYEQLLADAKVMVDFAKRREAIAQGIAKVAAEAKLTLREDDGLLNEVTGLVEHPVPLLCEFDAKFLDLPPEVLISEMKNHQRYFALYGADGKLTNRFITVANMENADGGARVKDGNGRVVRARLADGEFYWEQDRKVKLEDWGQKLSDVVFHARVGMMDVKVARIRSLAQTIHASIDTRFNPPSLETTLETAALCKADLTSGMVGEFPELQGIMGCYYATAQQLPKILAEAIRDHYKPQGASDTLPESLLARIISLADKLDSIASLFAVGEKPTGSKDPLALRRAALGIIRLLTDEANFWPNLPLTPLVEAAISLQPATANTPALHAEMMSFFEERLRGVLKDQDYASDVVEAVLAVHHADFPAVTQLAAAVLTHATDLAEGRAALAAVKRAQNLLAAEEKKDKKTYAFTLPLPALRDAEELRLCEALGAFPAKNLEAQMRALVGLTASIQAFFDTTLINSPEPALREARLQLLAGIRAAACTIADFSKIEG